MLGLLTAGVLILTALDHWSTWVCLRTEVHGWSVTEANPLSDWLFTQLGLLPGLALDSLVTLAALGFVWHTRLLPRRAKGAVLVLLLATTGYAVANNVGAMQALGLLPGMRG